MDFTGLLLTFLLVFLGVSVYVLFRWGVDPNSKERYSLVICADCWIYFIVAFLISIAAIWVYMLILSRGDSASYLVSLYYIIIIIAIFGASCFLFAHNPTPFQLLGIAIITFGLIIFTL